jgi:hypothetical protein
MSQGQLELNIHDGTELKDFVSTNEVNLFINNKVIAS